MSLNGVDIASYQKDMNCKSVDADFIIIKATQGTNYTNPSYKKQALDTLESGKLLGFYHYSTGCGANAEADYFLDKVKEFLGKAILCLDWEHNEKGGKNPIFGTAGEVSYCRQFANRIHEKTGIWPVIYMSASVTRVRDWTYVAQVCPLWVAQYPNDILTGYKLDPWKDKKGLGAWNAKGEFIRQYSPSGTIRGYEQSAKHKLDLDIAYTTKEGWMKIASPNSEPSFAKPVSPEIVLAVLNNEYGTGATRIQKLTNAGYNVVDIQKKINELNDIAIKKVKPIKNSVGDYWECLTKLL